MKFTNFKTWLNENKTYDEIVSKFDLKKYPIIIPPNNKDKCVNMYFNMLKKESNDKNFVLVMGEKEYKKEDFKNNEVEILKEIKKMPFKQLQHEVVHAIQDIKYPKLSNNEFVGKKEFWSAVFKNYENHKIYLSMPHEIMAYAFSWAVGDYSSNQFGKSVKKRYEEIGGKVLELFNKYLDEYKEKLVF